MQNATTRFGIRIQAYPAKRLRSRQCAFTLVELLVLIAIICILSALMMPALVKTLETSRTANCANNQKQISSAVWMYAEANNGFLPVFLLNNPAYPNYDLNYAFHYAVYLGKEYMNSQWDLWRCPSDYFPPIYPPNTGYVRYSYVQIAGNNSTNLGYWSGVSPLFNTNFDRTIWDYTTNHKNSFRISQVDTGAMYLGESHKSLAVIRVAPPAGGVGGKAQVSELTYAHNAGTANFLFVDGHVERLILPVANIDPRGNRWPGR